MHTFSETGAGVPAFLAKLWRLVEDPETNNLICWSKDGRSFIIQNQAQFARELLPLNYKHNNMASFIRQLNMYGFHKITSIDNGGLKFDRDEMEFSHPCFKRNCPYLLEHIKRKIANTKSIDEKATVKPEAVSKVLNDVKAMRGRQDSLDSKFSVMKQENEALWREIASLRQKHAKQQQIVNKLIQFLITIVQPSRNMTSVKRHMQLMINDTPEQAKLRKASTSESEGGGPVIHELGEELFDDDGEEEYDLSGDPSSPYANMPSVGSSRQDNDSPSPKVERPQSNVSVSSNTVDYSNLSADDAMNLQTTTPAAIINTVNPDGSQIVYHVTEVADPTPEPETFNEENHLTTPMVKEMKRNQTMKMKTKQNKRKSPASSTSSSSSPAAKMLRTSSGMDQLEIKTEKNEFNPMMFLNTDYPSPGAANTLSPSQAAVKIGPPSVESNASSSATSSINLNTAIDPRLISPRSEDSQQVIPTSNDNMYNRDDFLASDMPAELFEVNESPIIDDPNLVSSGSYTDRYDLRSKPGSSGQQEQEQLRQQSPGKLLEYNSGPSSSASSSSLPKNSKLQVAKLNNNGNKPDDLRDEVNLHLDGVQDDLDTLKDLLRSDTYSLDANTLIGLFNDSEILGPYGLSMVPDNVLDKKGSELMTYQPVYDLADIMDINDKSADSNTNTNTNADNITNKDRSKVTPSTPSSVLNTPYHE